MFTSPGPSLLRSSCVLFRLCASKSSPSSTGTFKLFAFSCSRPLHVAPCRHSSSNTIKVRSYLQYLKRKVISPPTPPYSHICQVGDPVLRCHAAAVDPSEVTGPEVQKVIRTMVKVMRRLDCVGLSAPQIGVPLRILAIEYPQTMLEESSDVWRESRGLAVQPLTIFINPRMRVLDGRTVCFQEACESISGYSATVPRYLSVEVSGLNEKGVATTWQASDWLARIVQHEMDHLDGVLYIDRMDSKTFIDINWQVHND